MRVKQEKLGHEGETRKNVVLRSLNDQIPPELQPLGLPDEMMFLIFYKLLNDT